MLQIFCTNGCILIGQIQLLALWLTGQGIGYNVQWSLPVQYSDGQLIHTFEPTWLTSTRVRLCKNMLPWFVLYCCSNNMMMVCTPLRTIVVSTLRRNAAMVGARRNYWRYTKRVSSGGVTLMVYQPRYIRIMNRGSIYLRYHTLVDVRRVGLNG